jgi:hypothetical protein
MNKRPRIKIGPREINVIEDDLEFRKNKCTGNARKILTTIENVEIDLWFDKHYIDRHQFGDDNGKRDGIDTDIVEALVRKSLKHLLFYSCYVKNFTFINKNPDTGRALRVILQEELGNSMLHVVIEAHYININKYEITVKTAMCNTDFKLSDGQYCVEIHADTSTLWKMDNKKLLEVSSL